MSFLGAVAASVRQAIAIYTKDIKHPVLLIGAGNFTVASVLRSAGFKGIISACDVSLYTSALGAYLSDQPFEVTEKEDCPEPLKGLLCTQSTADIVASIALLYDLRESWKVKNPFQERVVNQYRDNWTNLLTATKEKLAIYKQHIGPINYAAQDGFAFMEEHGPEHTVFAYPPTYTAGYEKLEKLLHASIDWQPPEYREMTDKSLDLYQEISRFEAYYVVLEKNLQEVHDILGQPSAILPRGRNSFSHIIAKQAPKIVFRNITKSENIGPILSPDYVITGKEKISFAKISLGQSIRLNELFLSARIDYFTGGVGLSLACLLDGKVFGKMDFCPSSHAWKLPDDKPMIYIMSDLAVPSNRENRLAKLVLLCLLSNQVREAINERWATKFAWACTTAFAQFQASMKYRGLFTKHKVKETKGGYLLNYYAGFKDHDLTQVLDIWTKKYKKTS